MGSAAALAGAALWPSWLREAFAEPPKSCDPKAAAKVAPQSAIDVAAAFRRASRAKRPLLVFVIPADDSEKWDRGHAFGELLNHGSDADLAPIAGCDVVAATMEGLREIVPSAGRGEPVLVLVKTTALPATAEAFDVEMPTYDDIRAASKRSPSKPKADEDVIALRIKALGGLLRKALGSSPDRVKERADLVRAAIVKKPPSGTHWARTEGCGAIIEGARDHSMMGCGMAAVPEKSRRFLYFFSNDHL